MDISARERRASPRQSNDSTVLMKHNASAALPLGGAWGPTLGGAGLALLALHRR